jgi:CheY-like chemotaxis protein
VQRVLNHTFPKSVEVAVSVGGSRNLWPIQGDSTQLHQMLMNLCVNARDAMPSGGELRVSAENRELQDAQARLHAGARPGPYVRLCVADTGTGIPPELLDQIFEPFFTTKEYGKGTGLGLASVLGIVKGHSGFIHVESQVNHGTNMYVWLPAALETAQGAGFPGAAAQQAGAGQTVLVIDDEPHVRDITRRNLEALGYRVLTARGGLEAVEMYRGQRDTIRLVLTDMMMPEMDGQATIRALRALDRGLPIVVMSGLPVALEVGSPGEERIQAVLQKPFRANDLRQTLYAVIHSSSSESV